MRVPALETPAKWAEFVMGSISLPDCRDLVSCVPCAALDVAEALSTRLACDDSSWLVDSLRMALEKAGALLALTKAEHRGFTKVR